MEGKNKKELWSKMLFFHNIVEVPSDVEDTSSDEDMPQLIEQGGMYPPCTWPHVSDLGPHFEDPAGGASKNTKILCSIFIDFLCI